MKKILLVGGLLTNIDDEDYERFTNYKWYARKKPHTTYVYRLEGRKRIYMHQEILHPTGDQVIDHIDRDGLNNTRANLRLVDRRGNAENHAGRPEYRSTEYKGVDYDERCAKHYCARISPKLNGRQRTIRGPQRATPEEAARDHDLLAKLYFGDYAFQNFETPEGDWNPVYDVRFPHSTYRCKKCGNTITSEMQPLPPCPQCHPGTPKSRPCQHLNAIDDSRCNQPEDANIHDPLTAGSHVYDPAPPETSEKYWKCECGYHLNMEMADYCAVCGKHKPEAPEGHKRTLVAMHDHPLCPGCERLFDRIEELEATQKQMFDCCKGEKCLGAEHCHEPSGDGRTACLMKESTKHNILNESPVPEAPEGTVNGYCIACGHLICEHIKMSPAAATGTAAVTPIVGSAEAPSETAGDPEWKHDSNWHSIRYYDKEEHEWMRHPTCVSLAEAKAMLAVKEDIQAARDRAITTFVRRMHDLEAKLIAAEKQIVLDHQAVVCRNESIVDLETRLAAAETVTQGLSTLRDMMEKRIAELEAELDESDKVYEEDRKTIASLLEQRDKLDIAADMVTGKPGWYWTRILSPTMPDLREKYHQPAHWDRILEWDGHMWKSDDGWHVMTMETFKKNRLLGPEAEKPKDDQFHKL